MAELSKNETKIGSKLVKGNKHAGSQDLPFFENLPLHPFVARFSVGHVSWFFS
jgi:hypothetical protein